MKKEFSSFKIEMDGWVKELNSKFSRIEGLPAMISDNAQNVDHNYEIIQEMRTEMLAMKEELASLKVLQLLTLKERGIIQSNAVASSRKH